MPRHAVILGAGGASRGVIHALITGGFQRVIVFNRHLHRAEALVKFYSKSAAHMELRAMPWHESIIESELSKTKLFINATSIGLVPGESPIPGSILPPDLLVMDLIYNPRRTKLVEDAQAAGDTTLNGEAMLLHQGAAAFELWTGTPAPLDLMREKLEEAIAAGGSTEADETPVADHPVADAAEDGAAAGAVAASD